MKLLYVIYSLLAAGAGQPVLSSSFGTTGVRDPSIVSGGGAEPGKKRYIIGTDPDISKYVDSDSAHAGTASESQIRYAYTSDFQTFSAPQTCINASPTDVIDLAMLQTSGDSYVRFVKNESAKNVYMERSDNGIFGTWTRPGGAIAIIWQPTDGPHAYWNNLSPIMANLLMDHYSFDGDHPFISTNLDAHAWVDEDRTDSPTNIRKLGSVISDTG
ncbi:MAG: hypothetical protein Q9160_000202 [Pyrenula sp. 1 TL-2023]